MTTFSITQRRSCGSLAIGILLFSPVLPSFAASGLGIVGQGSAVMQPDIKRPGKFLWKLWARDFSFAAPDKTVSGALKGVSAIMFQDGKEAARMTAPQAQTENIKNTIVATGGVVVKSTVEPGTIIRADTITWDAPKKSIIATGHVFYRNGKTGMTIQPRGRLIADTGLKTVRSDDGGNIKLP